MSKLVKMESEFIVMVKVELKVYVECLDGMMILILCDGNFWEFWVSVDLVMLV